MGGSGGISRSVGPRLAEMRLGGGWRRKSGNSGNAGLPDHRPVAAEEEVPLQHDREVELGEAVLTSVVVTVAPVVQVSAVVTAPIARASVSQERVRLGGFVKRYSCQSEAARPRHASVAPRAAF